MWLGIAAMTLKRSITGQMFFAPCLGTNLYAQAPRGGGAGAELEKEKEKV
jgi:hypothetical protein